MAINWEKRRISQQPRSEEDQRSNYQRDHARLVHSAAFRRLQSKTQVLGVGESDFYRTRLTHSMEVAQIGTSILAFLRKRHPCGSDIHSALPARALLNAVCLAHDIGHPPFGHGGEVALNYCMREHGGFEGNGQTLRILSKLDKYKKNYGINPTRRLLLGVLKYPISYSSAKGNTKSPTPPMVNSWLIKASSWKPPKCYLDSEADVVNFIFEEHKKADREEFMEFSKSSSEYSFMKAKYKSLDTSIMDLADDISYGIHDLEDMIALKLISRDDWDEHIKSEVLSSETPNKLFNSDSYNRKDAVGELINLMITNTYVAENDSKTISDPVLRLNAKLNEPQSNLLSQLKKLVLEKVIRSPTVQQLEFHGQKVVIELFEALSCDPERLLPSSTLDTYNSSNHPARVICDFISGMTDIYATKLYERIFMTRMGSIFDRM